MITSLFMRAASLLSVALIVVVSFSPATPAHAQSSAQTTCTSCTKQKRQDCGVTCQNQPSREQFDRCSDECVLHSCQKECAQAGLPREVMLNNPHARCLRCIQDQELHDCERECSTSTMNTTPCIKKCARRKCGDICDVTDLPVIVEQPSTKIDCEMCRNSAKVTCAQKDECHPGQPGAVACQLTCVTLTCRARCTPDDEDQ